MLKEELMQHSGKHDLVTRFYDTCKFPRVFALLLGK